MLPIVVLMKNVSFFSKTVVFDRLKCDLNISKCPFYCNIGCCLYFLECTLCIVSSRVSATPKKIDLIPFYPAPPPPNNSKSVRPPYPLYEENLSKFWRTWLPHPKPMKCTLIQKSKGSFSKETKDFISNNEVLSHLNVEI